MSYKWKKRESPLQEPSKIWKMHSFFTHWDEGKIRDNSKIKKVEKEMGKDYRSDSKNLE